MTQILMAHQTDHLRFLLQKALSDYVNEQERAKLGVEVQELADSKYRSLNEAIEHIKFQCNAEWARLTELQGTSDLSTLEKHSTVEQQNIIGTQRLAILKLEERRLQSEISHRKYDATTVQEKHPEVIRITVKKQVLDTIEKYKQALDILHSEKEEVEEKLSKEKKVLSECQIITSTLKEKVSNMRQAQQDGVQGSMIAEMKKEALDVKKRAARVMHELICFIEEHYPPHSLDDRDDKKSSRRRKKNELEVKDDRENQQNLTTSLGNILEDLMNLSVSNPGDPYLDMKPGNFWPPYVELLIKAGVAQRHPKDATRLKLVQFHL